MSSGSRRLACLYTNQKTKKRKRWDDGFVIVNGSGLCVLYNADIDMALAPLDTRQLLPQQAASILAGRLKDVEFDGYLVTIEDTQTTSIQTLAKPVPLVRKIPKFKIPTAVAKPIPVSNPVYDAENATASAQNTTSRPPPVVKGKYVVHEDELDDIWGSSTAPAPVAEHHLKQSVVLPQVVAPFLQLEDDVSDDEAYGEVQGGAEIVPTLLTRSLSAAASVDLWGCPAFEDDDD